MKFRVILITGLALAGVSAANAQPTTNTTEAAHHDAQRRAAQERDSHHQAQIAYKRDAAARDAQLDQQRRNLAAQKQQRAAQGAAYRAHQAELHGKRTSAAQPH